MTTSLRLGHRARSLRLALTSSLWFIPGVMVGLAVLLAIGLVEHAGTSPR